jgi:hypothetical protein
LAVLGEELLCHVQQRAQPRILDRRRERTREARLAKDVLARRLHRGDERHLTERACHAVDQLPHNVARRDERADRGVLRIVLERREWLLLLLLLLLRERSAETFGRQRGRHNQFVSVSLSIGSGARRCGDERKRGLLGLKKIGEANETSVIIE